MSRRDIVLVLTGITVNAMLGLLSALIIAVALCSPAHALSVIDIGQGATAYNNPIFASADIEGVPVRLGNESDTAQTPPQQLAQPGDVDSSKTELKPGDTVYILPTTTPLDSNGYVPFCVFQSATVGICTYVREKPFHPEFSPHTIYITYYEFSISGKVRTYRTEKTIPQQKVLFYNLP